MIDTHAHIYAEEFAGDYDQIIANAKSEGVQKILMPNIDVSSIERMHQLEESNPDYCFAMMGLHPCYVKEDYQKQLAIIEKYLFSRSYVAVGEIGTDLHWDQSTWDIQVAAFKQQCGWALELNLPVAIHCRESIDETIELVRPFASKGLKGVFHCFSGTVEQGQKMIDMDFMLGIGGVVTFKNGGLKEVVPNLDLNHLIVETDAPYLAPTPNRGKRNEPAFVSLVVDKISEVLEASAAEIAKKTSENATRLFFPDKK